MSRYRKSTETEVLNHEPKYRVSWWTRDAETGNPVWNFLEYDEIGAARRAFKDLPEASEPAAERLDWHESTRAWVATDLIGRGRTPDEARADRVRGIGMLRAVMAHKRGLDTRGMKRHGRPLDLGEMLKLDHGVETRGHDHHNGAENCPICSRRIAEENPSECVVCDYLCEHGREPVHPGAGLVQGELGEQLDERF